MHFHIKVLLYFWLYCFNFVIECQISKNDITYYSQKPYHSMNLQKTYQRKKIDQNLKDKFIVKKKYTEEDFRNMNNQYAQEQNNQQLMNGIGENASKSSKPVYGGDRPSECQQKNTYFCPSRKSLNDDWKCIKLDDLCDSYPDCPNFEDENPTICMFHLLLKNQFQNFVKVVKSTFEIRWGEQ